MRKQLFQKLGEFNGETLQNQYNFFDPNHVHYL
jgi:hypothetical protein